MTFASLVLLMQLSAKTPAVELGPVQDCQPCKLTPKAGTEPYSFKFELRTTKDGQRSVSAIAVSSSDGKVQQRLDVGEMEPVGPTQPFFLRNDDINSDGWGDLSLVTGTGASNEYTHYWLFLPGTGSYKDLGIHPTLKIDRKRHRITSYETGGMAGLIHESNEYAFVGDDLVITRSEKQDLLDQSKNLFQKEIRVRKGDKLVLVKSKTIKK
ncbi:MAG TPA: hypothetical protein VNG73_00300 [Gemmatimonadaceae bacterium]|nr:hypothetical protein [Gemmatimonadaceae bacterium]